MLRHGELTSMYGILLLCVARILQKPVPTAASVQIMSSAAATDHIAEPSDHGAVS